MKGDTENSVTKRKMKKRIIALLLTAIVGCAMVFTSCGDNGDGDDTGTGTNTAKVSDTAKTTDTEKTTDTAKTTDSAAAGDSDTTK